MIGGGRAGFGRVAALGGCQRRWGGGYSAAIMVARDPPRPLRAVRSAWRTVSEWVSRQLITGNRRVALLLAVVTAFISVAAVHVSQSWFSPGLLILPVLAGGPPPWPPPPRRPFLLVAPRPALPRLGGRGRPRPLPTDV